MYTSRTGYSPYSTTAEYYIYGSSRLGTYTPIEYEYYSGKIVTGLRNYEITNHLGNVISVINAQVNIHGNDVTAQVLSTSDYYAFGSTMEGRTWNDDFYSYKYGFNVKEKDSEADWGSTQYDYGFRIYNPEIGKFLSVDPLTKSYPMLTPYQFASNSPVQAVDFDGLEARNVINNDIENAPTQGQLKALKSNNYDFWKDLLTFEKRYAFQTLIDANQSIRRQEMKRASGGERNTDYYAITITQLPPKMTKDALYNFIRKNLNNFMNYEVATFGATDKKDREIWKTNHPAGAVMTFYNDKDVSFRCRI